MDKIPELHKIDYIKYLESVIDMSDKALKEINSIGVQPSTPWPQNQTPSDTLKYVPYESPNDKPIGPGNTKIKRDGSDWKPFYVTFCFCAAFVLCGAVGLTLGAIFGSSL
jgi:hypothetical protein